MTTAPTGHVLVHASPSGLRASIVLRNHFCYQCAKVDTWPLTRVYRSKLGIVKVYECPNCGKEHEFVVKA